MTVLDPLILREAAIRASQLVASGLFNADEWEDLRNEIALDCLRRDAEFDPRRGSRPGWVSGVAHNSTAVLARKRKQRARREVLADDFRTGRLGEVSEREVGLDRIDLDFAKYLHLRIDVDRLVLSLPAHVQEIALLLMEWKVVEICAITQRSRSRVYEIIDQIRQVFAEAGFGNRRSRPAHARRVPFDGEQPWPAPARYEFGLNKAKEA